MFETSGAILNAPLLFSLGVAMLDYERLLIQSVAQRPDDAARILMSPKSDVGDDWFVTPCVKKFFSSLASLSVYETPVTISSILLYRDSQLGGFTAPEIAEIAGVWKQGLAEDPIDVQLLTRNVKMDVTRRRASDAIDHYTESVSKEPYKVESHIDALGSRLALISHGVADYDPTPSVHLDEPTMTMRGSWGNAVLDKMFSRNNTEQTGGKPAYGMVIASFPTGSGKTTLANTIAAYSLAYSDDKVVVMSNEIVRSIYSSTIFRALKGIYAGSESDERLKEMMDDRLRIYAPSSSRDRDRRGISVDNFELFQKIVVWERPQVAIVDSISGVSAPQWASKMSENKAHEIKADAFRNLCLDRNILTYAPGNMSEEHQKVLKGNKPDKLQSVMLFGSTAYQNASDWCFLGWRDYTQPNVVNIKRTKNRHGSSLGERWQMVYSAETGIYHPTQEVSIN